MLATAMSFCLLAVVLFFSVPAALAVTPPVVQEEAVSNVAGTSATLQAKINPEGSETTYRFEYGTSEAYGSQIPIPDGIVGSGSVGVTVSAHPQDLLSSTTYHYRVVALVASRGETAPGSDGSFMTQPAGGEFALPDGRQWELVSPPNKYGALIGSLSDEGPIQAAEDGGGMTYGTNVPTELEPAGYRQTVQVLSMRGAQGWSSRDIATPNDQRTGLGKPEYQFFAKDLSLSLADPIGEHLTLLSDQASAPTPYIRREGLCDAPASASKCYLPVLTSKEGFADVSPGAKFGEGEFAIFEGASPDLRHVVVDGEGLTGPTPFGVKEIYEWSAGVRPAEALQLVSVLPVSEGGGPTSQSAYVGGEGGRLPSGAGHAVSDDGSRVFWMLGYHDGGVRVYMRDTVKGETVRLDVQQPGVPSGGEPYAVFKIASSDGSKVFFTVVNGSQRLTVQSGTRGKDLYECEIVEEAGKLKCKLTDLTPVSGGQSAEAQGPLGASEDGSYLYFVANGVLGDGAERGATRGTCEWGGPSSATCNLYEYHNGVTAFIATVAADDQLDWAPEEERLTARVSPDGRYLAFMSERSLTGYDNRDAVSGKPDMEVYLYDAVSKRLVCTSCNPTGSRPVGIEMAEFSVFGKEPRPNLAAVANGGSSGGTFGARNWVAANLPAANKVNEGGFGNALYQPRLLSDNGRLFFGSSDALMSQDVNGNEDVYEFEPEGVGGCTASSVTFNPKSGGCVGLISSGTSPEESGFMDASRSGGDVFFLTESRLTSQDYDTALDVYVAHECSASVPCVAPPVSSPPCSSGDSCKTAPAPQPSIFGAPSSATFVGAGNIVGSSSTPGVRPKSLTRAQKLAAALKACRKRPKRKRAGCERQAGKRYGAKAARGTVGAMGKVRG
jgi:hypothetical protein